MMCMYAMQELTKDKGDSQGEARIHQVGADGFMDVLFLQMCFIITKTDRLFSWLVIVSVIYATHFTPRPRARTVVASVLGAN